jgi:hypothetical protein
MGLRLGGSVMRVSAVPFFLPLSVRVDTVADDFTLGLPSPFLPGLTAPGQQLPTQRRHRARPSAASPVPIPVPNLTKKSRGRRVPTVASLYGRTGEFARRPAAAAARLYTCKVPGCGKCFARGEHLKRHVRSVHTYEKREFSRLFPSHPVIPPLPMIANTPSYSRSAQMSVPRLRKGLFAARQSGPAHARPQGFRRKALRGLVIPWAALLPYI